MKWSKQLWLFSIKEWNTRGLNLGARIVDCLLVVVAVVAVVAAKRKVSIHMDYGRNDYFDL